MFERLLLLVNSNQTRGTKIRLCMHETLLLLETDRRFFIVYLFTAVGNFLEGLTQVPMLLRLADLIIIIEVVHVLPMHLVIEHSVLHYFL